MICSYVPHRRHPKLSRCNLMAWGLESANIPQCRPVLFLHGLKLPQLSQNWKIDRKPDQHGGKKKKQRFPCDFSWTNPLKHCETRSTMSKKMESHERTIENHRNNCIFIGLRNKKIHCAPFEQPWAATQAAFCGSTAVAIYVFPMALDGARCRKRPCRQVVTVVGKKMP